MGEQQAAEAPGVAGHARTDTDSLPIALAGGVEGERPNWASAWPDRGRVTASPRRLVPSGHPAVRYPSGAYPRGFEGLEVWKRQETGVGQASLTLAAPVGWLFGAVWADNAGGIEGAPRGKVESPPYYTSDEYCRGDRAPLAPRGRPGAR